MLEVAGVEGKVCIEKDHVQKERLVAPACVEKVRDAFQHDGVRNGQAARGRERRVAEGSIGARVVRHIRTLAADASARTSERLVLARKIGGLVAAGRKVVHESRSDA